MTAESETEPGAPRLCLLAELLNAVPLQAELRRELGAAIDEAGEVRDSASPTLGELRYVLPAPLGHYINSLGEPSLSQR